MLLQDLENFGSTPVLRLDDGITIFRQNSRDVIDQAATRDVRESLDLCGRNSSEQRLIILVRAQQLVANRTC